MNLIILNMKLILILYWNLEFGNNMKMIELILKNELLKLNYNRNLIILNMNLNLKFKYEFIFNN